MERAIGRGDVTVELTGIVTILAVRLDLSQFWEPLFSTCIFYAIPGIMADSDIKIRITLFTDV
jgi:hypothetical protein